jgi:hypothetical protein
MTRLLVRLVQSGANQAALDKLLVLLKKFLSGALVQRFPGVGGPNFNFTVGSNSKLSGYHLRKIAHQRTSRRFPANYQRLGWCVLFCTSLRQQHQPGDGPCL